AAGVNDDRPCHDDNASLPRPDATHFPRQTINDQLNAPLTADRSTHKRKLVTRRLAGRWRCDAHTFDATDNLVSFPKVAYQRALDRWSLAIMVDNQHRIHPLLRRPQPLAVHAHIRWIDGGGVKAIGRDAVL